MEKKTPVLLKLIMPLLIAIFCSGLLLILSIKPYEKLQTYLRVAFMDNHTVVPEKGGITGLTIVKSDIDTEFDGDVFENGNIIYPEYGTQYAVLTCEKGDMYVPIYWGGGSELLELGACNTPSSMAVGGDGNTVISAHVNTFFRNLNKLDSGDTIVIYTDYGRFTYTVSENIEFLSTDKSYLRKTEDNVLTLYTCEQNLLAESDKRIGVRCVLEKKEFYEEAETEEATE